MDTPAKRLLLYILGDAPVDAWTKDPEGLWRTRFKALFPDFTKTKFKELQMTAAMKSFVPGESFGDRRFKQLDILNDPSRQMYYFKRAFSEAPPGSRVPLVGIKPWTDESEDESGDESEDESGDESEDESGDESEDESESDPNLAMLKACFGVTKHDVEAWDKDNDIFNARIRKHLTDMGFHTCGDLWYKVRNEGAVYYLESYTPVVGVPPDVFIEAIVCRDGPGACLCNKDGCWRKDRGWKDEHKQNFNDDGTMRYR